jgi:redox-sensitive bicupin YhaK (pirin superfamily)
MLKEKTMLELRSLHQIANADIGWLRARHHFAIGSYGNPAHGPVGNLYVWNDDEIAPRSGFPLHHHANVEIITYVREGAITHEDSLGNRGRTVAGDVQVMSAGTGIRHSERNEETVPTRIFQIWIHPSEQDGTPRWGSKPFPKSDRSGRFIPLASGSAVDGALPIRADAEVYGAVLPVGVTSEVALHAGESAYLVPAVGTVLVNDQRVEACEGIAVRQEALIRIEAVADAEVVLVVTGALPDRRGT